MDASLAILDEEETEEALSLSSSPTARFPPRSAPVLISDEFFEFSSGSNADMSHAEDIIFCGKLISLNQKSHDQVREQAHGDCNKSVVTREEEEREKDNNNNIKQLHNEVKYATQPNSPRSKYMKTSKSLDYQQLRRSLSSDCRSAGIRRYSSARTSGMYDNSGEKVHKPRWYSMLFGLVSKVPREMDLRDMKNRLVRRTPSTMFHQPDHGNILSTKRNPNKSSSWNLLGVLSCRDNASVGVVATLGCMTHVNGCESTYSRATCM